MILPGKDGIDHINIFSRGKTVLGRWLSNFADAPITLPEDGEFRTIEGYWYWLCSRSDQLRWMSGSEAKKFGKMTTRIIPVSNFEEKILKAIDIKINSYPDMAKMLRDSDLPLCHYYVMRGRVIDAGPDWIVDHLTQRRQDLQSLNSLYIQIPD